MHREDVQIQRGLERSPIAQLAREGSGQTTGAHPRRASRDKSRAPVADTPQAKAKFKSSIIAEPILGAYEPCDATGITTNVP